MTVKADGTTVDGSTREDGHPRKETLFNAFGFEEETEVRPQDAKPGEQPKTEPTTSKPAQPEAEARPKESQVEVLVLEDDAPTDVPPEVIHEPAPDAAPAPVVEAPAPTADAAVSAPPPADESASEPVPR